MVRPPHEVVGCLIVVYIVVGKTLVRVMVAEGAAEKEKEERERERRQKKEKNRGGRLVFCRLWTRFSSYSCHEIHIYL